MIHTSRLRKSRWKQDLRQALPLFAYEHDKVVFRDGRVGVGYRLQGAEMETWTQADYQAYNHSFQQQVAMLEAGTIVQKTDIYFDREYRGDKDRTAYFELKTRQHMMYRLLLEQESYLFLSFPPQGKKPLKINPLNTLLIASESLLKGVFHQIAYTLEVAEHKASAFVQGLDDLQGVKFIRLKEEELRTLYARYFSLGFEKETQAQNGLFCEISADAHGIQVGEKRVQVLSLKGQGSYLDDAVRNQLGVSAPYTFPLSAYLQIPHITTTSMKVEDTARMLKKLDFRKRMNQSMDWMGTQDNEVMAAEINEFTQMVRQQAGKTVSVNLNLMICEADPYLKKSYLEKALTAIGALSGAKAILEATDTLALFMANAPGNAYNNYRWVLMSDEMACKYFHFIEGYRKGRVGDLLSDRFLNPIRVHFFNDQLANQNAIVIGPSGSGKSFTNGYFMIQRKERGARQVIIDVGGTYKNTVLALNGAHFKETYIEYDPENPPAFAPFHLEREASGSFKLSTDKVNFLMSLLFTMSRGKEAAGVKQVEKSLLHHLIVNYYLSLENADASPSFGSFYQYCQSISGVKSEAKDAYRYFDLDEFLLVLRPFYDGAYQHLLNGSKQQDLSQYNLVCFDLARIRNDQMLYPIICLLIIQLVLDQLSYYPDDEKYLYMDEAWSMLEGTLSEFMESMYRTVRKMKGAIWIITQTVQDIANSTIASAILSNADTRVLLRHSDQQQLTETSRILGLTTHQQDQFASLRRENNYREIFVKMGDMAKVFAIEASPYHAAVLSSKPDERNELIRLLKRFNKQEMAIEEFVENKMNSHGSV